MELALQESEGGGRPHWDVEWVGPAQLAVKKAPR